MLYETLVAESTPDTETEGTPESTPSNDDQPAETTGLAQDGEGDETKSDDDQSDGGQSDGGQSDGGQSDGGQSDGG